MKEPRRFRRGLLLLCSSDLDLHLVTDEEAVVDVHVSLEVITDCLFRDILDDVVLSHLVVESEASEVVREDECTARGEVHCRRLYELRMVSLDIEAVSSALAVRERRGITENQVESVVGIPEPVHDICLVEVVAEGRRVAVELEVLLEPREIRSRRVDADCAECASLESIEGSSSRVAEEVQESLVCSHVLDELSHRSVVEEYSCRGSP